MTDKLPFTIEILEFEAESPAALDRVIGGSMYFEEAKRIGQHLLSVVDTGTRPRGYRVLSHDQEVVYIWRPDDIPGQDRHNGECLLLARKADIRRNTDI